MMKSFFEPKAINIWSDNACGNISIPLYILNGCLKPWSEEGSSAGGYGIVRKASTCEITPILAFSPYVTVFGMRDQQMWSDNMVYLCNSK